MSSDGSVCGHTFPMPANETTRLQALHELNLLDTPREQSFDKITALAAKLFKVPIALVSLIDTDRQWFKSNIGSITSVPETPRDQAFCAHAVMPDAPDVFVVLDATQDERFKDNPLVTGGPLIRFYAGAPLLVSVGSGQIVRLGTICVIDTVPREEFSVMDKQSLMDVASLVVDAIQLRQQTAQELVAFKQQYITCTAHDIRTPLTAFQLSIGMLEEGGDLSKEQMAIVRQASIAADLMNLTVDKAIDVARTAMGVSLPTAKEEPVVLEELLSKCAALMEQSVLQVELRCEIDPKLPPVITSDGTMLWRCLINLLMNAGKVTSEGFISVTLSRSDDELSIRANVCDTGPGVDDELKERLFTAFTQDAEAKDGMGIGLWSVKQCAHLLGGQCGVADHRTGEGEKIGALFWVEVPLVAHHADESDADSAKAAARVPMEESPAIGSASASAVAAAAKAALCSGNRAGMAMLESPIVDARTTGGAAAAAAAAAAPPPGQPPLSPMAPAAQAAAAHAAAAVKAAAVAPTASQPGKPAPTALVIDDSATVRKLISAMLRRWGYDVSTACNGLEGLLALKAKHYEVAFVDFLMPIMDGCTLIKSIREHERGLAGTAAAASASSSAAAAPPRQVLIGVSANASSRDVALARTYGMDAFLQKPLSMHKLKQVIKLSTGVDVDHLPKPSRSGIAGGMTAAEAAKAASASAAAAAAAAAERGVKRGRVNERTSDDPVLAKALVRTAWRAPGTTPRALVIEDSLSTSTLLLNMLKSNGFEASEVHDGASALQRLQAEPFDLVLCDSVLPRLTGPELMARYREWEMLNRNYGAPRTQGVVLRSLIIRMSATHAGALSLFSTSAEHSSTSSEPEPFLQKPMLAVKLKALLADILSARSAAHALIDASGAAAKRSKA